MSFFEDSDCLVSASGANENRVQAAPFGTEGSSALAGVGNFDLAAAFGDMLHALATGSFMTDILPSL